MNRTRYIITLVTLFLLLSTNTYAQKGGNNSITDSIKTAIKIELDTIVTHKNPQFILNFSDIFTKNNYKRYGETLMAYESTDSIFTLFGVSVESIVFLTKDEKVVYFEIEFNKNNNEFINEFTKVFDEEDTKIEGEYYIYYYFNNDYYRINQTSLRFKYVSQWADEIKTKALSKLKK